jgi:hypothetical protein
MVLCFSKSAPSIDNFFLQCGFLRKVYCKAPVQLLEQIVTWDLGPGTWDLGPGTWDHGEVLAGDATGGHVWIHGSAAAEGMLPPKAPPLA